MAITIITKKQTPSVTVFKDEQAVFTVLPQVPLIPLVDADVTSKKYVDDQLGAAIIAAAAGLDVKASVRLATTSGSGNVGTYNATNGAASRGQITAAPSVVDGISVLIGNRILVKNQTNGAANGIYTVSTVGTGANGVWDRATDFDADSEVTANAFTFIEEGSTLADTAWVITTDGNITIGGASGTVIVWTQFAGAGVGVATISVTTANGLSGVSSGGNTPAITLSTSLAAGPVRSNGAGAFVSGLTSLTTEVSGTLPVGNGGTGATTFASGALLKGNGAGAILVASAADIVGQIGTTFVTNATNSTNASNVTVTNDVATATPVFISWFSANSGNLPNRVSSTNLSFVPSTGVLSATGFSGNGSALTSLTAANITGTLGSAVLGASTLFIGTTAIALNRASANQAITGILSVQFPGATSGTVTLVPSAIAGTTTLTMPATSGTLITTGDTGTVTNTMLAGSIADSKLLQITTASKVSTAALTGTLFTLGSTAVAALSTVTSIVGLTSVTSTSFVGALTGNSDTATKLSTARTISGTGEATFTTNGFDGSANATGVVTLVNAAVIGKVLTGYVSGAGTLAATDTILQAFNKLDGNIALKMSTVTSAVYKVGVAVSGAANGTNLAFVLPNTPIAGTEMVFVNGVVQQRGAGNDYQITGANVTFEAGNAPQAASIIIATYFV
jgi:hypothetical protein